MIPTPTFFVSGTPEGQGNHRIAKRGKFSRIYEANGNLDPWRDAVARTAMVNGWTGRVVLDCPVALSVAFIIKRKESHFGKNGLLKSSPALPHTAGDDLDKLVRAIGDALTGIVYRDDRRIVCAPTCKLWGPREGALISVAPFAVGETGSFDYSAGAGLEQYAEWHRALWPRLPFAEAWAMAPKYDTTTQKAIKGAA